MRVPASETDGRTDGDTNSAHPVSRHHICAAQLPAGHPITAACDGKLLAIIVGRSSSWPGRPVVRGNAGLQLLKHC